MTRSMQVGSELMKGNLTMQNYGDALLFLVCASVWLKPFEVLWANFEDFSHIDGYSYSYVLQ